MARIRIEIQWGALFLPGVSQTSRVELTGASAAVTFARAVAACLPLLRVDAPGLVRMLRMIRLQQIRHEGPLAEGSPGEAASRDLPG